MSKQKVAVYYPVGGSVHPAFCKAMCDLHRFELLNPADDYEILPPHYSASLYVQENRNLLVEIAREQGADWLLQIDTDESFDPHVLRQLMKTAHKDTRPIVFGLYTNVMRGPAGQDGSFFMLDMIYKECADGQYEAMVPTHDHVPFPIDAAGTGLCLTHLSVFEKIEEPWFWLERIVPTGKTKPQIMNEDIAFCRKAREAGYILWCDPLAEAVHYKQLAIMPSTFRRFMDRAQNVKQELMGRAA